MHYICFNHIFWNFTYSQVPIKYSYIHQNYQNHQNHHSNFSDMNNKLQMTLDKFKIWKEPQFKRRSRNTYYIFLRLLEKREKSRKRSNIRRDGSHNNHQLLMDYYVVLLPIMIDYGHVIKELHSVIQFGCRNTKFFTMERILRQHHTTIIYFRWIALLFHQY